MLQIKIEQEAEAKAAERSAALEEPKALLLKYEAELNDFKAGNMAYTTEMAMIESQIAQLQVAVDQLYVRLPGLEGEKKAAAASRNFKEAGRLSKEITAAKEELAAKQGKHPSCR